MIPLWHALRAPSQVAPTKPKKSPQARPPSAPASPRPPDISPMLVAPQSCPRRPPRQSLSPATRSARVSARSVARSQQSPSRQIPSWQFPFILFKQPSQLLSLFTRTFAARQRVHHQLACGPVKHSLQNIARQLPLGFLRSLIRFVHVRALILVAPHRAFLRHDLH